MAADNDARGALAIAELGKLCRRLPSLVDLPFQRSDFGPACLKATQFHDRTAIYQAAVASLDRPLGSRSWTFLETSGTSRGNQPTGNLWNQPTDGKPLEPADGKPLEPADRTLAPVFRPSS